MTPGHALATEMNAASAASSSAKKRNPERLANNMVADIELQRDNRYGVWAVVQENTDWIPTPDLSDHLLIARGSRMMIFSLPRRSLLYSKAAPTLCY